MKTAALFSIALSVFVLAAAVAYHAGTGRYQISSVTGVAGVYQTDTKTGEVSICTPVYESGCITLTQAHLQIVQQRENIVNSAQQATGAIDQFTKDKARDLRNAIQKFAPAPAPDQPAPAQQ